MNVSLAGSFTVQREAKPAPEPTPTPPHQLWRVKHDTEIHEERFTYPGHGQYYHPEGWDWRMLGRKAPAYPEVFWLLGSHSVPFDERWQWLSFLLNPQMSRMNWRDLYSDWIAFMNGSGFPHVPPTDPNYKPKWDYVNRIDEGAKLPGWDKVRVCGGATISGRRDGDTVIVDTLDFYNPPTLAWLVKRPWFYFHALSIGYKLDANGNKLTVNGKYVPSLEKFPQNGSFPTLVPLIAIEEVRIPLGAVEQVNEVVDPYRFF